MRFMRTESLIAAVAAVLQIVPFTVGNAQDPRPLTRSESVPIDLATALASSGGLGGEPQILVGALPGWATNKMYIPANARVIGSAFIGTTVIGVLHVAEDPEAIIATLKRELTTRGWKTPPAQQSFGGGFRPAVVNVDPSLTRFSFCSDPQILAGSAARRQGLYTEVIIRMSTATGNFSPCNPPRLPAGMPRAPYPTLYNPPGAVDARFNGDCSSDMFGSNSTSTTVRTAMAPDAVLDHYAKQLADSGWSFSGDKASTIGRSWTRTDSTGAPVELSMSVTTSARDATCRDVSLIVRTRRKP